MPFKKIRNRCSKNLLKDPAYQKSLIDVMKNPDYEKMVLDVMKTAPYRQQMMTVMEESIQSPLFRAQMVELLEVRHRSSKVSLNKCLLQKGRKKEIKQRRR